MTKPTCEELFLEDGYEEIQRNVDDTWRHGVYVWHIFQSLYDNTLWAASYEQSNDGETNGLREGIADIEQVWPQEVITTQYTSEKPQ